MMNLEDIRSLHLPPKELSMKYPIGYSRPRTERMLS